MDGFVRQEWTGSLLLHEGAILYEFREVYSLFVQVRVFWAHKNEVSALAAREVVAFAHHKRHVVKLVNFKRVEN
jgi:hypothetical protein